MKTNENPKRAIFSLAYLPPLDYMSGLVQFEHACFELHETYPKQSWRNRCRIATAQGEKNLSIPIHKPNGNHSKTNQVVISKHCNWQKNHWQTMVSAYGNAPYFFHYKDLLEPFYLEPQSILLWEFNLNLLCTILEEINARIIIEMTEGYESQPPHGTVDLREAFSPKKSTSAACGVLPEYQQVFGDRSGFVSNASIVDLLFNAGPESLAYLRSVSLSTLG